MTHISGNILGTRRYIVKNYGILQRGRRVSSAFDIALKSLYVDINILGHGNELKINTINLVK
jgi:hypothetical protein